MSNIIKARLTIKGIRPLLLHHFGPESMGGGGRQERTGTAGNDPQEWRKGALITKQGQLYVEPTYAFGMLRDAAKHMKKGSIQSAVAATLQTEDERILINRFYPGYPNGNGKDFDINKAEPPERDPELPVYLDVRAVRNPSTKGRNVRYRIAASPGWSMTFTILWDKAIVSREQMELVAVDASNLTGIGDGRAIGFGRFQVESFEVIQP